MRLSITYLFFLFLFICGASSAYAGWKKINQLSDPVSAGFFTDQYTGFIGTGSYPSPSQPPKIFRTTDGGTSWQQSKTPNFGSGWVSSIFMKDAKVGYASVFSFDYTLWKTTDGGITWFDNAGEALSSATSVFVTNKALILTAWSGSSSGGISLDSGQNFQHIFTSRLNRSNGIDFSDDLTGVVTMGPSEPNNYWITSDGGVSWLPSQLMKEAWSVYGVKKTKTFFVMPEGDHFQTNEILYRSDDGGKTWIQRYAFNQSPFPTFTGHIAGKDSTLYIQTEDNTNVGLYRSDNLGVTWKSIGGPSNTRDTRFVVTGCVGEVVYAFDKNNGVWKTTDGGDGTLLPPGGGAVLTFLQDSLYVETHNCQPVRWDIDLLNPSCDSLNIDSLTIIPNPYKEFSIDTTSKGITLESSSSLTIPIIFQSDSNVTRHSVLHIRAHAGDRIIDTTIILVAQHSTAPAPLLGTIKKTQVGDTLLVPIYLEPTQDSFSISHFSLHISYDGNILTPASTPYQTIGTLTENANISPGEANQNGEFITADLTNPVTQISDLSRPFIFLRFLVTLSQSMSCQIRLDSFTISRAAPLALCSIPESTFEVEPECGDSLLSDFMLGGKLPIFLSVHPNPDFNGEILADISLSKSELLTVEITGVMGKTIMTVCTQKQFTNGLHTLPINTSSLASGVYMLRVHTSESVLQREIIIEH